VKVLFFLRGIHYDRIFENLLRELLERGHKIHVVLVQEKSDQREDKTRLFDEFWERYSFSYEQLPRRRDVWVVPAVATRYGLDYLRYLEPEYSSADPLRARAGERAPAVVRRLLTAPVFRGRRGRRLVGGVLRTSEAVLPVPRSLKKLIKAHDPDVVLVSPLVGLGSLEGDHVRAAQALGIPTVLVVASWDNLSNKGLIHDVPERTIVWNQTQVEEAVKWHGIPRERIVAVGAHSFDHWFTWQPSRTRAEFMRGLGLDHERQLILYVGSSLFISGNETGFIREWRERLSGHPRLRECAVLVRPHPLNLLGWDELDIEEPGKTVVWPRAGAEPRGEQAKLDYFDSLFHAQAMVGVSTSALVEAAILRLPALTYVTGRFPAQEGTLHFSYIAPGGEDGLVRVAHSWEEHLDQVADAIEAPERSEARIDGFVAHFIRPNGVGTPAAPAAVDAIEEAAALEVAPQRVVRTGRLLMSAFTPLLWLATPIMQPRQTWRRSSKKARRWIKHVQKAKKSQRPLRTLHRHYRRVRASFDRARKRRRRAAKERRWSVLRFGRLEKRPRKAAVHRNERTRNVGGPVRREEAHDVADLAGPPDAPDRDLARVLMPELADTGRVDQAGGDAVDGDASRSELARERLRPGDDA
jgi:hypothetical protein